MKKRFDEAGVPIDGRRLVLCSDHVADLLMCDQKFADQYHNYTTGKILNMYSFEIYEYMSNPHYSNAGAKIAFTGTPSAGQYQASIAFYTKRMFKATGTTKFYYSDAATNPTMRDLGDARLKGAQNAQSELTRLKLLYKGLTDENVARKDRLRIAKELQDKYPSYFGNLTAEQMLAGKATGAYMKLSTAILQAAKARAIADKITDNEKKNLELEGQYAMKTRRNGN